MMGMTRFLAEVVHECLCVRGFFDDFVERAEWTFGSFERVSLAKKEHGIQSIEKS